MAVDQLGREADGVRRDGGQAFQKGMVSQKESTRGMPMVTPRSGARAGAS